MTADKPQVAIRGRQFRANPDLVVFGLWLGTMIVLLCCRKDFWGDGLRHLRPILEGRLLLGEPRWMLFPPLLYGIARPFIVAGIVDDIDGIARVFQIVSIASTVVYALSMRRILIERGIAPLERASALFLGLATSPMFRMATDIMEPTLAIPLVAVALAILARASTEANLLRRLWVATALVAFASLIYQGMLLSLGLVPLVLGREATARLLKHPLRLTLSAAPLAIAFVVPILVVMSRGQSFAEAVYLLFKATRNPLTLSFPSPPSMSPGKLAAAFVFGPSVNIAGPLFWPGVHGLVAALRDPSSRGAAAGDLLTIVAGVFLMSGLAWAAWRRRDWTPFVAVAAIMVLPVLRSTQNTYVKFFVLLPLVLSIASILLRPRFVFIAAIAVFGINVVRFSREVREGRTAFAKYVPFYESLPASACFLTSGWAPPINQHFTRPVCPALGYLAANDAGRGLSPEAIVAQNQEILATCYERCICSDGPVLTDDMLLRNRGEISAIFDHFGFASVPVDSVLLDSHDVRTDGIPPGMFAATREKQSSACESIQSHLSQPSR